MDFIPDYGKTIIEELDKNGFEAYAVGGCVRDRIMGAECADLDIATSASPEAVVSVFGKSRVVPTGIQHGTVTVITDKGTAEVTTYRIDGAYSDHRRPSSVAFTSNLEEDLARRDFTMNALAYNPKTGVVDPFGGRKDISDGIIRCVGDPDVRFAEDALRIMRALRFSATLGFDIAEQTSAALRRHRELLKNISAERIAAEFKKLLTAHNPTPVLREYSDVISVFIPEILPCMGFPKCSENTPLDLWEHTLNAIEASPPIPAVRFALFFCNITMPLRDISTAGDTLFAEPCPSADAELAGMLMRRLKYDNKTRITAKTLIANRCCEIAPNETSIRKALRRFGENTLQMLLCVKAANDTAQSFFRYRTFEIDEIQTVFNRVLERGDCFDLSQLAVNGSDIKEHFDINGKKIGAVLDLLLDAVIEDKCKNEKTALLSLAETLL